MLYNRQSPLITLRKKNAFTATCSYDPITRSPLVLLVGFSRLLLLPLVVVWSCAWLIFSSAFQKRSQLLLWSRASLPASESGKPKAKAKQLKKKISTWQRRLGGLCLSVRHDDHSNNCCHHHIGIALILEMYQF